MTIHSTDPRETLITVLREHLGRTSPAALLTACSSHDLINVHNTLAIVEINSLLDHNWLNDHYSPEMLGDDMEQLGLLAFS